MLDISWSSVYAIYAIQYLASHEGRFVPVWEIARKGGIPEKFLSNLFPSLRKKGIVRARRGQGYLLHRPPGQISIYDIVQAVDGARDNSAACLMKNSDCVARPGCTLNSTWERVHGLVSEALRDVTIDRLPRHPEGPLCLHPTPEPKSA